MAAWLRTARRPTVPRNVRARTTASLAVSLVSRTTTLTSSTAHAAHNDNPRSTGRIHHAARGSRGPPAVRFGSSTSTPASRISDSPIAISGSSSEDAGHPKLPP